MDGSLVRPVTRIARGDPGRHRTQQRSARPVRCSVSPADRTWNGGDIVSDRVLWLQERCPTCRAASGARCRARSFSRTSPPTPAARRARVADAAVPNVQGRSGRAVSKAVRTPGLAHASGAATPRTARARVERVVLAGARGAGHDDGVGSIQRPRRPGWSRRQDRRMLHQFGPTSSW